MAWTTCTTSTTSSTGNCILWNGSTNCTTTSSSTPVYATWTYNDSYTTVGSDWSSNVPRRRSVTAEENRRFLEREAERERIRLAENEKYEERVAARKKAERLLKRLMSATQRRDWQRHRYFHVRSDSGKRYRIRGDTLIANIDELDANGKCVRRLCAHPMSDIPICDSLLAQKLMLETDERLFLRTANVHPALAA